MRSTFREFSKLLESSKEEHYPRDSIKYVAPKGKQILLVISSISRPHILQYGVPLLTFDEIISVSVPKNTDIIYITCVYRNIDSPSDMVGKCHFIPSIKLDEKLNWLLIDIMEE